MYRRHEIQLQTVVVSGDAVEIRYRIVRPQHRRAERRRQRLQFLQIRWGLAKHEVEVDGRDWRAL